MMKRKVIEKILPFLAWEEEREESTISLAIDMYGEFTGVVYLNAKNEEDKKLLLKKFLPLLRGKKLTIIQERKGK